MVTETVYLEQEEARRQKEAKEAQARAAAAQVTQPQQPTSGFNDRIPSGEPVQSPLETMVQQNPLAAFFVMLFAMLFGGKDLFGKSGLSDIQNAFKGYTDQDATDDNADFAPQKRIEKLYTSGTTKVAPMDMSRIPSGDRQKAVIAAMPAAAQAAGVSPDLLKGLWGVESGFGTNLTSPTGCKGDFQFTRGTFRSVVNEYNEQIASSIEKDMGNKALADRVRAMKGQSASQMGPERDNPTIATYAAAFYAKEVAQAVKVDPKQESSFGAIYAGYNVGPGNALKLKRLEAQGSDASAKAILGYVAQVNPMFYKNGANASEALANYQNAVKTRANDFDRKFGPNATATASLAAPSAAASVAAATTGGNIPSSSGAGLSGLNIAQRYNPNLPYGKSATENAKPFDSIVLHVSGKPTMESSIAYSQSVDANRGGQYGYTFLIGRDGQIVQTAPLDKRTNHIKPDLDRSYGNDRSLGIALVGAVQGATPEQMKAAAALTDALQRQYGIRNDRVVGHGTIQSDRAHGLGPQHHDHGREGAEVLAYIRQQQNSPGTAVAARPAESAPSASQASPADSRRTTVSAASAELGNWLSAKLPGIAHIFGDKADPATAKTEAAKTDVTIAKADADANKPAAPTAPAAKADDEHKHPKPAVTAPALA